MWLSAIRPARRVNESDRLLPVSVQALPPARFAEGRVVTPEFKSNSSWLYIHKL